MPTNEEHPELRRRPTELPIPPLNVIGSSPGGSPTLEGPVSALPPIEIGKTREMPAYEFLGYLPDSYGTKKLFLVARDPRILFAYWDLSQVQYQEGARAAKDGKVFLEIYVPGEGRVAQVHVWDSHRNWYLQVNRPDTEFVAQLGYYRPDGGFEVLARSGQVRTPRETVSPNTDARFVTIPFSLSFRELYDVIKAQSTPGEELVETLARLQQTNVELPFETHVPRALTAQEGEQFSDVLGADEEVRRRMIGSFEITDILRKRFETMVTSGQWMSSLGVSSLSSPFGASFGRERGFHMHVNAELIIYGGTEPNARVRVDGQDITLGPDGTFHYHFVFPDGQFHIPIDATSVDGVERRSALLSFLRLTELEGDVRKTGQPVVDEPIGRTS